MIILREGHVDVVKVLLEHGAHVDGPPLLPGYFPGLLCILGVEGRCVQSRHPYSIAQPDDLCKVRENM